MQERCVDLVEKRLDSQRDSENTLYHAQEHCKLIRLFGRFPHRNDILGRESTFEERRFLDNGGYTP